MSAVAGFLYLNVGNQWPGFVLNQIEITAGGELQLSQSGTTFVSRGVVLAGPVGAPNASADWFRLTALADDLPAGTHVQFFTLTTSAAGTPPFDPASDTPFNDSAWNAIPLDAPQGVITNPPGTFLWLGAILRGTASASPVIRQIRVDYGRDTWLTHLPAIYQQQPQSGFLQRFLSLNASVLDDVEAEITGLSRLFDPFAAPSEGYPSWLEWLSGWLAFDLDENWSDERKRRYIAEAFELHGRRGTPEGLRRYLKIYAGVEAIIVEAGRYAQMWSLGEVSRLGSDTRLAPGPLQGAVLGSSAIVDQARMSPDGDRGASLYENVAHLFCVQVYASDLNRPGALETVRQVLDLEKPAHTVYRLSVIEPRMRIGAQSRIGIDTIVAAGQPQAQIGKPLGGRVLASAAVPCTNPEDIRS